VEVSSRAGGAFVASASAAGAYVVSGLPTGRYTVKAEGYGGEMPEYYDDVSAPASLLDATPVDVTAGELTPGIDFVLSPGGRVAGTVTRADTGQPLANARVSIHGAAGTQISSATTNASGQYVSQGGLPTGKYTVLASAPYGVADLASRLYKGIDCLTTDLYWNSDCAPGSGDAVSVTSPNTTSGIDFALPVGGAISGTVTDAASGAGISGLSVSASVVNGAGRQASRSAPTATGGVFTVTGLPPGGYYVLADGGQTAYVDQLYNNVACAACDVRLGQRVDVRSEATRTGVNFALTRGGAIDGRVTSVATGLGVRAAVWAYAATGQSVTSVAAAPSGHYTIPGLAPGSYRVLVAADGFGYLGQLYSGIPCPNQNCSVPGGTPVSVTAGTTTGGIDFVLATGGSITGFVRDAAGHAAGTYVFGFPEGFGWVQLDGHYRLTGLTPGGQYVGVAAGDFVDEVYDDVPCFGCDPATSGATAVTVVAGAVTSGIDFTLDAGASIGGAVTSGGQPVGGVTVRFLKSGALYQYGYASTRVDGTYRQLGVPPGTYHAVATKEGFDSRLYDGLACPGTCDLTTGTPFTVSGVAPVTGIDFNLSTQSLDFYTVPPCRALDTRNAVGGLGGPALGCQGGRNFPVAGTCGVPFDAKALSVNATVTGSTENGHLRLHAGRTAIPTASSLNYALGLTRANNAIVPLGTMGEIGIYCGQASGTTHAIVDVNGYFK
jgi:hypothetical protein